MYMWPCVHICEHACRWPEDNLRCHLPVSYCNDISYKPGTLHAGFTGWLNNSIFSRNEKTEGSWLLNLGCYVSHGVGLQIQRYGCPFLCHQEPSLILYYIDTPSCTLPLWLLFK